METTKLKKFAQSARRTLLTQVSSKLKLVLAKDSAARRENPLAVAELEQQLAANSDKQVVEQVAYLWFNRLCALRFMDANAYNRIRVVSPADGQFQPEILAEAKAGHIDEGLLQGKLREQVLALLSGAAPSRDPQGEAYRLLVVAVCNDYHRLMPYLFARIDDYSELLMPDDLLSENSILAYTREAMTLEACESVEVIGWLYQFYISEKKDEVFEGLKNNKKITAENIPAATQLFTPHWIVRYLVENSLGRLWLLNHPQSGIRAQMAYYIEPETPERDFLKIRSPEELKICDPACGSGHMLTYAYDLLFAIYGDAGYDAAEIPEKILTHNLYGIEIDERAAELAAFALAMKALKGDPLGAGNNRRRFFRKPLKPNICRLEKVVVSAQAVDDYVGFVGRDLFTADLRQTLKQFEEADNVGSLIRPALRNAADALATLEAKDVAGQLFLTGTHASVLKVLRQAAYLSPQYHVVIANPPYMGSKGMNGRLAAWIKDHYPDSKSDLFAAFIERNLDLAQKQGAVAMITMQSWMFLSSFEKLRTKLLDTKTITSMAHLGARAFDSIGGEVVSTTAFVLENAHRPDYKGNYLRLVDGNSETEKQTAILTATKNPACGYLFHVAALDFEKIPGSPIAYWASPKVRDLFVNSPSLASIAKPRQGLATSDNDRFLKQWYEPQIQSIGFGLTKKEAFESSCKWFPCQKGGMFRKWYGNNDYVVNWENDGSEIKSLVIARYGSASKRVVNEDMYFSQGLTWSSLSSSALSMRYVAGGFIFETKGSMCFFEDESVLYDSLAFANSSVINPLLQCVSPTLDFHEGLLVDCRL
ncbi:BREX-1 system adenine-specific DNA-methyltransferase PglX [Candidatus Thiothrix anitrata]|uniref:site-specific DNA-methyltransferase (adenine-specific) n=1 Tax=Candidatus Thiothrix anitrata TaxID=2823902 RepID=A0ABX7WYM2_9GAMM|nr:BREX-1 system adenine-specific DNA-methyltransferase PglX [Candidatus Thiothrix anitrata]QTR48784.1 BREX-1 system adenine-specific DNA-methyltransferase PglX [Candidatus Thiothrix anitrata]